MPRGSNPHKFTDEQRQRGLEKARLARMANAKARREAKAAAEHQPVETLDDLPERAKEAATPQEPKGQQQELKKTFSQFLVLGTVMGAWALQQPAVAMTDREAGAFAVPLANIFARSELNRTFGRYLTGSNDYVALLWAGFQYAQRVAENWISNEKVQPIRHTPEARNVGVPAGTGAEQPVTSPKSAANGSGPSAGILIQRQSFGGAWRNAN